MAEGNIGIGEDQLPRAQYTEKAQVEISLFGEKVPGIWEITEVELGCDGEYEYTVVGKQEGEEITARIRESEILSTVAEQAL